MNTGGGRAKWKNHKRKIVEKICGCAYLSQHTENQRSEKQFSQCSRHILNWIVFHSDVETVHTFVTQTYNYFDHMLIQ